MGIKSGSSDTYMLKDNSDKPHVVCAEASTSDEVSVVDGTINVHPSQNYVSGGTDQAEQMQEVASGEI